MGNHVTLKALHNNHHLFSGESVIWAGIGREVLSLCHVHQWDSWPEVSDRVGDVSDSPER
jgi:hypothetical protein